MEENGYIIVNAPTYQVALPTLESVKDVHPQNQSDLFCIEILKLKRRVEMLEGELNGRFNLALGE